MVERFVFPSKGILRDAIGAARVDYDYDVICRRETNLPSSPEVFFIESISVSAKGKPVYVPSHAWVHFIMGAEALLNSMIALDPVMQERLIDGARQYYRTEIEAKKNT